VRQEALKIAIAQMRMAWTLERNTRSILEHLAQARTLGADLAVFPECATTGFHRRVPEQTSRAGIQQATRRIQAECAALKLPAIVGTPFFPSAEEVPIWNAALVIDSGGDIAAVCPKIGLTQSEATFFQAGTARPTFSLGSVDCAVLLCREVRDAEYIRPHLAGVRVVFWPGAIAWNSRRATHPENVVTREIASACARTLGAYLIQCNWAESLNDPEASGMGGSLVISPAGEIIHECGVGQAGVSIVTAAPDDVCVDDHSVVPIRAVDVIRSGIQRNPKEDPVIDAPLPTISS
jgi:omega-amidase